MKRLSLLSAIALAMAIAPAYAQTTTPEATDAGGESALRRFEIITLTALPFTAIHSFLVVKGYKVAREGSFAANVEGSDWNVVGAGAALFAVGIGVYDYMRMRGKDRNEPLLPEQPPATPFSTSSASRTFQPPLVAAGFNF